MAGNVAEWTGSYFYEGAYNLMSDLSPRIFATKRKIPIAPARSVRWCAEEVGKISPSIYRLVPVTTKYQDTAKSYIGFRTVIDLAPIKK
jgi:formylglycine-generating enzyme required for sulfatase activity